MSRAPLRDVRQADTMSAGDTTKHTPSKATKHTPDKSIDKAAMAAAAKLVDSARKSQSKNLSKKMKLSLKKSSGGVSKKSSARVLALSLHTESELNDTVEFQDTKPMKISSRQPHASRKRKAVEHSERDQRLKSLRQGCKKTEPDKVTSIRSTSFQGKSIQKAANKKVLTTKMLNTASASASFDSACKNSCDGPENIVPARGLNADSSAAFSSSVRPSDSEDDKASQSGSQSERDVSMSQHTCPSCGEVVHGKFVRHIQKCLKEQFASDWAKPPASEDTDQIMKDSRAYQTKEDLSTVGISEDKKQADYCFCQLCQKDLTHLNSHRRTMHINHCMDKEQEKLQEEEARLKALETAKNKVLDCPLCGQKLRTVPSRKTHLKKCASNLGVSSEQLLVAVKRQEEEHLVLLEAGILPDSCRPGRSGRTNSTSTRRGVATLPKSKLDEDTQLALAISSSLHPEADVREAVPSTSGTTTTVPTTRRGRKNKQDADYLLLQLTEAQAAGRIETRVSQLITWQEDTEDEENIPPLPKVSRNLLCGETTVGVCCLAAEDTEHSKMFWRLSSLEECSGKTTEEDDADSAVMDFYVPALMPPVEVSCVAAGSKIRRMSEIPGRLGSQQPWPAAESEETDDEADFTVNKGTPPPSTQTAALLAEMASEADVIDAMQFPSSSDQPVCDIEKQVHYDLLSDLSSLVNQQEFSDVVIHTAGETTLYAHGAILSVRCPALLKLTEPSGAVDLSDCPADCVLAVLNFLYAGETQLTQSSVRETLLLAQRLGLTALEEICRIRQPLQTMPDLINQHQELSQLDARMSPNLINTQAASDENDQMDLDISMKSRYENLNVEDDRGHGKAPGDGSSEEWKQRMESDSCLCENGELPSQHMKEIQDHLSSPGGIDNKRPSQLSNGSALHETARMGKTQNSSTDSAHGVTELNDRPPQADSRSSDPEKGLHCKENIVHSDRSLLPGANHEGDSPQNSKATENEDQSVSGKMDNFSSQEFEKELTQRIQVVVQMVDKERRSSGEVRTENSLHHLTLHNLSATAYTSQPIKFTKQSEDNSGNNSTNNSCFTKTTSKNSPATNIAHTEELTDKDFSDNDSFCLLDDNLQVDDGNDHSQDREASIRNNKTVAVDTNKARADTFSCSKMDGMAKISDAGAQPSTGIIVSDEDLFSDDDLEIYSLPSSPLQDAECSVGENCDTVTREAATTPISESSTLRTTLHEKKQKGGKDNAGMEEGTSLNEVGETLMETDANATTLISPSLGQKHPATTVGHNFSSFSMSTIEHSSHTSNSLSSPHIGHFKTSTPQSSSADVRQSGRTGNNSGSGRDCRQSSQESLKDDVNISKPAAETQKRKPEQDGKLSDRADVGGLSSVVATDTPQAGAGVSVVNEDSLYITPATNRSKSRFIFQIVTPAVQQQEEEALATPSVLPLAATDTRSETSCHAGHGRMEQRRMSGGWAGVGGSDNGLRSHHRSTHEEGIQGDITRGSGDSFKEKIDSSDSDLEIIDSSLHDASLSPKFSKPSSSQSQSGTASTNSQHSSGCHQPVSQTDSSSPPMNSQHKRRQTGLSQTQQIDHSGEKLSRRLTRSESDTPTSHQPMNQTDSSSQKSCQAKKRRVSLTQPVVDQSETIGKKRLNVRQRRQSETQGESLESLQEGCKPLTSSATTSAAQGIPSSGSPLSRFSQCSADSDKEMASAVDLVLPFHLSAAREVDGRDPGGADASPPQLQLSDGEMVECSCPTDQDVWEGFNNLDAYNPDLDIELLGHDVALSPASDTAGCTDVNQQGWAVVTASLVEGQATSSGSPSRVQLKTRGEKSPVTKQSSQPPLSSPAKSPVSPQTKSLRRLPRYPTRRASTGPSDQPKTLPHHQQLDEFMTPARLTTADESYSNSAADANSSFLWSEENAPTDTDADPPGGTALEEEGALVLGREETVQEELTEHRSTLTPRGPQKGRKKGGKSAWVPPSPFTPMPSFDTMATPDLKNEVQKYGLKLVGKRRMKLILKDIYAKTHQYETDSDCDWDDPPTLEAHDQQTTSEKQPPVLQKHSDKHRSRPRAKALLTKPPVLHKHSSLQNLKSCPPVLHREVSNCGRELAGGEQNPPPLLHIECDKEGQDLDLDLPPVLHKEADSNKRPETKRGLAAKGIAARGQAMKKRQPTSKSVAMRGENSDELPVLDPVPSCTTQRRERGRPKGNVHAQSPAKSTSDWSSSPENDGASSQDSDGSNYPDVSVLEEQVVDSDDEDITPSQQSAPDLQQKLMQFFQTQPGLYHKVLTYEPLDMVVLKNDLKAAGLRCSQEKLRNFLNAKCITFTTKNMLPGNQHRGRKPGSKKTKASQK